MRSLLLSGAALVLLVACSSNDTTTPVADASPMNDVGTGPDTSTPPDASQPDTSTPVDAGPDAALPPITCAAPTVIDTAHKAASPLRATSVASGKLVVAWAETTGNALKSRFYDGSTWQAEHAFTATVATGSTTGRLATDGLGNAILQWVSLGGANTHAAVMSSSGTWGAEKAFNLVNPWNDLTTLAAGGGASIFTDTSNVETSIYSTGSSTWSALDTRQAGNFTYAYIASNAAGKMAAMWTKAAGAGAHQADVAISWYNGSTWSSVVTETVGTGGNGASAIGVAVGVYANGDPVVVFRDQTQTGEKDYAQRYQVGSSTWAAAEKISDGQSGQLSHLFVDASDRMTYVFPNPSTGNTMATRNTGSGWSAAVDLGAGLTDVGRPVMDRATGNLAVVVKSNGKYGVTRITAAGTTWETPIMSTLATGLDYALAFDGAHAVIAAEQGVPTDVEVSVCQ